MKVKIQFQPWIVEFPDGWEQTAGGSEFTQAAQNYLYGHWEELTSKQDRPAILTIEETA